MRRYFCRYTDASEAGIGNPCWQFADVQYIDQYPWKNEERPYAPQTQLRLLHNEEALFVRFDIREKHIRATYTQMNDPVCRDSCVEFFFCPQQTDERYLSFEINPLGALLIGLGASGSNITYLTDDRGQFEIETACKKDFWQAAYRIPISFLRKYFSQVSRELRGNFMKCADRSRTPHHGCWNLIGTEIPMFHVPRYFGEIRLLPPEEGRAVHRGGTDG